MSSRAPIIQRIRIRFWWGSYSPLEAMSAWAPSLPARCKLEVNTSGAWRAPEDTDLYNMRTWLEDNDFYLSKTDQVRERNGTNRAWMGLFCMTWAKHALVVESPAAFRERIIERVSEDSALNHLAGY